MKKLTEFIIPFIGCFNGILDNRYLRLLIILNKFYLKREPENLSSKEYKRFNRALFKAR